LLATQRGTYIIGQALAQAIHAMKQIKPEVMQEKSNIEDMEMLGMLFQPFYSMIKESLIDKSTD
jgi:hypothetical protein